ncbi:MAG: hypothetical protein OXN89_20715, partial [Bryobacterales bacterium]|nr:hypothetical protein [Bryobacterales bacterium]
MVDQHCIAETLATPAAVETLTVLLAQSGAVSRTQFTRQVCRHFGFRDARDRLQVASCQKALRSLDGAGRIALPAASHGGLPLPHKSRAGLLLRRG